jgi:glycosyltransferase involved in cell wall biosynthesis
LTKLTKILKKSFSSHETTKVSIIIPTKNNAATLKDCLKSIINQDYKNIEILVIDNQSDDQTQSIAKHYTEKIFNQGSERSAQRNFGAKKAKGEFLLFIDADMILERSVIAACVKKIIAEPNLAGLIIPERSEGTSFWARCRGLERPFYVGNDLIEAPRFFPTEKFKQTGGYDENLVSGEDWDLAQRVKKIGQVTRIDLYIIHNEGYLKLKKLLQKKRYYARKIDKYSQQQENKSLFQSQRGWPRVSIFFSQPKKLLKNPFLTLGMLFMKGCEYMVYLQERKRKAKR